MTAHQGRGKGLEAWVASELAAAEAVGLLRHWKRMEPAMRALGGGKFAPKGGASAPDYIAITQDGDAVYVECKEILSQPGWDLKLLETHQAADLSDLPGSLVVIRWASGTVAMPWAALQPTWSAYQERTGRAASGEASLTRQQALELGREVTTGAQALGWAIVDAARDAARRVA
jgi:hypothetical protein